MSMRQMLLVAFLFSFSCTRQRDADQIPLSPGEEENSLRLPSVEERAFVSYGYRLGQELRRIDLSAEEKDLVVRGLLHALEGKQLYFDYYKNFGAMQRILSSRQRDRFKANLEQSRKDLVEFQQKFQTHDGKERMQFRVSEKGSGKRPVESARVSIRLSELDPRKDFAPLYTEELESVRLSKTMKGLRMGVMALREGGEVLLGIPPHLAFGDDDSAFSFGGQAIFYQVKLLKIHQQ